MHREQLLFGTWGVWLAASDPLWRFCDAMLHWDCYANWEHRTRFGRSYFDFWVELEKENPYWFRAYHDETVFVTVNPSLADSSAWVHVAANGTRHPVEISDWDVWLVNESLAGMHPIEGTALNIAKRVLRRVVPSAASLLDRVDPHSKSELILRLKEEAARRADEQRQKQERTERRNRACAEFYCEVLRTGLACPACGVFSRDYRHSTKEGSPSLVVCRACGDVVSVPFDE